MGLALATLACVTVLVALVSEVFVESVQQAAEAFGMTPAFVGFIVVALVGGAAEMTSAFSAARKNRLDMSVGIALGSASQIALFVAPVLVLLSYVIGPAPMNLQFWPGAIVMMLIATMTASLVTNSGRSAWFVGVLVLNGLPDLRHDAVHAAAEGVMSAAVADTGSSKRAPGSDRSGLRSAVRTDHGPHVHGLTQRRRVRPRRCAHDADRRARVQRRLGHHRRNAVPDGLPRRKRKRTHHLAGGADGGSIRKSRSATSPTPCRR